MSYIKIGDKEYFLIMCTGCEILMLVQADYDPHDIRKVRAMFPNIDENQYHWGNCERKKYIYAKISCKIDIVLIPKITLVVGGSTIGGE